MRRSTSSRRRSSMVAAATALATAAAFGPSALPALADHTPQPDRVTLMGSLMSELGCGTDWDGKCTATDLPQVGDTDIFSAVFTVPAGNYEFKVRLDGSWDENYGDSTGTYGLGGNIPLPLEHAAALRFSYDHATHAVTVAPAQDQPSLVASDADLARDSLRTDLSRERFYFVMADRFANGSTANDTGGLTGGRLETGFDPTSKGFYHGGDLAGITQKLDYIEGMGTTAIWMTPSFKNKPVQGSPGSESAGYHGYWITDFTQVDPHLGTNAELKTLIDAAHKRGIKVFFDIITNHTADVQTYEPDAYVGDPGNQSVPYVSKEDQPYLDVAGNPFDDADYAAGGNGFPEVSADVTFPYTPVVPADQTDVKVPAWLNDPTMYHNRGTSTFAGENSMYGDFPSGDRSELDDLWTERPEVVTGMEDIYKTWVDEAGVDGFRIDTVKHVNIEFWQQFAPALKGYAASKGNDDFFMFGEVYDANPKFMSRYTTTGNLQATVDFGFQASASAYAQGGTHSAKDLQAFFASDDWFTDADSNAYSLPTFLGNHDMGRIGMFLAGSGATGTTLLERDQLAHELMFTTRGQPVVYYGDEQGFVGDGGDQDARQDMFPSKVSSYNDDPLIGQPGSTATANFGTKSSPMYRTISALAGLREANPALADGAQVDRYADDGAGVYAFSRIQQGENVEYMVAANSSDTDRTVTVPTYAGGQVFTRIWPTASVAKNENRGGRAAIRSDRSGSLKITVPARSLRVWKAHRALRDDRLSPEVTLTSPAPGAILDGRYEVGVATARTDFQQATVAWRQVGAEEWTVLGTDDNAPYRVHHDVTGLPKGALVEYRVVVKDHDGDLGVASSWGVVGTPPVVVAPVGPVEQPSAVSVPGSHGSEVGCAGGDWQPDCSQLQMTLDPNDDIWKTTLAVPAGGYAFKAAINKAWDPENYGAGGVLKGADIGYTSDGTPVTFWYDHRTHWVTNSRIDDLVVATGSFQSELGCKADDDPNCLRAWLQDPDGDGVYALGLTDVPAGTYTVQVARNGSLEGSLTTFTVADGEATTFTYDPASQALSVVTD